MMVDLFVKRRIVTVTVALVGLIIPLVFAITQALTLDFSVAHHAFSGMLVVDPYAVFFKIVFLIIAAVMILASYSYVGKYVRADGEFYTLMLFSATGTMFMASTGRTDLDLHLARIDEYSPLCHGGPDSHGRTFGEAAVKYVLLGAMSSAILLYGFALLYGLTGTTDLMGIATLIKNGFHNGNVIVSRAT